ncbi:uncharacterized protein CLAFUR5_05216 [Fulvia fulva]|uniref:Uncharacterized protein n=1 Tax=Passalora fulva TaxID=5499 RepID=A0A9Q8LID8_PASFU|nr:uncharacterized protein CLAFUR5_05216 [Fulvia fulva]KAK4617284.1 hypothetical protein CLAFUR0_10636 [Fulvia fulva]UJO17168.1 hypothetical protein CLAFUR5_05216 [Fulvia fulva]
MEDIGKRALTGLQDRLDELRDLANFIPHAPKLPTSTGPPGGGENDEGGEDGDNNDDDGEDNNDDGEDNNDDGEDNDEDGEDDEGGEDNNDDGEDDNDDGEDNDDGGEDNEGGEDNNDQTTTASSSLSTQSSSSSSSSESCTQSTTTEDVYVTCSATSTIPASGTTSPGTASPSYVCITKTSTISGCSVTGATSTTSSLATETATSIPVCMVESCGAECGLGRRSLAAVNESVFEIEKRVFPPSNSLRGGFGVWMNTMLGKLDSDEDNRIVPLEGSYAKKPNGEPDTSRDYPGATSWKTVEFHKTWTGLGLRGLMGCTAIIVVSKKGAFMAHTWEAPGWLRKPRPDETHNELQESDLSLWARDVKVAPFALSYRTPDNKKWRGISHLHAPGEILEEPLHAFLVSPYHGSGQYRSWRAAQTRTFRYEARLEMLQYHLGYETGLAEGAIEIEGYTPAGKERLESGFHANGRVLIEYDPEAKKTTSEYRDDKGNICKDEKIEAGLRIWVDENELVYEKLWDPLEHQKDEDDGSSTPRPPGRRGIGSSLAERLFGSWGSRARRQDNMPVCSKESTESGSATTSTTSSSISSSNSSSMATITPSSSSSSALSLNSMKPTPVTTLTHLGCTIMAWGGGATPRASYCECAGENNVATLATHDGSIACEAWPITTSTLIVDTEVATSTTTSRSVGSYTTEFPTAVCPWKMANNPGCTSFTETRVFSTHADLTNEVLSTKTISSWSEFVATPVWWTTTKTSVYVINTEVHTFTTTSDDATLTVLSTTVVSSWSSIVPTETGVQWWTKL